MNEQISISGSVPHPVSQSFRGRRNNSLSIAGFITGLLSMVLIFAGEPIAERIHPDPILPLLTKRDNTPLSQDELKSALVDFASEAAERASQRVSESTVSSGKQAARDLWDRVKRIASDEADGTPSGEEKGTEAEAEKQDAAPITTQNVGNEDAAWRNIKINMINPPSPEKKRLVLYLGAAAVAGGMLAFALGLAGWIRREDQRICLCSSFVGLVALSWVYLMSLLAKTAISILLGGLAG